MSNNLYEYELFFGMEDEWVTEQTDMNNLLNILFNQSLDAFEYKERHSNQLNINEQKILETALQESLNTYKTQERKPDINLKLDKVLFCDKNKELYKIDNCRICFDDFSNDDEIGKTVCNHLFHYKCILEWGKYKQECPLCKESLPCE